MGYKEKNSPTLPLVLLFLGTSHIWGQRALAKYSFDGTLTVWGASVDSIAACPLQFPQYAFDMGAQILQQNEAIPRHSQAMWSFGQVRCIW